MNCGTCKFFHAGRSECRRYAPQPTADQKNAYWPIVASSDWCGEYQPAQQAPAAASA